MALRRGTKFKRGYATIPQDEGVNYRDIADTMTELGYPMNHSSARNYTLRIMQKFVAAMAHAYDIDIDEQRIVLVAKSPSFQKSMAEVLQTIESERRRRCLLKKK